MPKRALVFIGFLFLHGGCVTFSKLGEDAQAVRASIAIARERGAYNCAPTALARAEAHLDFLEYELDEGDFLRAQRHHDVAVLAASEALDFSDKKSCAASHQAQGNGVDRDADTVADAIDQCPDEAEDHDSFDDADGCPDPDNDADTVLDLVDKCPNMPGDVRSAGCPGSDRDGDGLLDTVDLCPDIAEDQDGVDDGDGCAEEENLDIDGDGVKNVEDACPGEAEDFDGYNDSDGCPDPDNDLDTVLDMVDVCPLQAGPPESQGCPSLDRDVDGFTDDIDQCPDVPGGPPHGCPKRVLVAKKHDRIEIREQIMFESNRGKIRGKLSVEILDQIASVLASNPSIKIVIEGHTDSAGSADYNLRLSDARAHAVRDALIERGVAAERLEAIGYGESRPIASNKSAKGRASNRRVDFVIPN